MSRMREGTAVKKAKRVTLVELQRESNRVGMAGRDGVFLSATVKGELVAWPPFGGCIQMAGRARFLYPDGILPHGPWFACTQSEADAIRTWGSIEWQALNAAEAEVVQ